MRAERAGPLCTPAWAGWLRCGASHWAGEDSHNPHDLKTRKRPLTLPPRHGRGHSPCLITRQSGQ